MSELCKYVRNHNKLVVPRIPFPFDTNRVSTSKMTSNGEDIVDNFEISSNAQVIPETSDSDRTVKDMLNEYGSTTGFTGISRVYYYHTKQRWWAYVFWIVVSLIFFSTMLYFLHKMKLSYDESPYSTKIQEINPRELAYPVISICRWLRVADSWNENSLIYANAKTAENFNFSARLAGYFTTFQDDPAYIRVLAKSEQQAVEQEYQNFKASQSNSNDTNWFRDFLTEATTIDCNQFFVLHQFEEIGISAPKGELCKFMAKPILSNREFCYILKLNVPDSNNNFTKATTSYQLAQARNGINGGLDIYVNSTNENYGIWVGFSSPHNPINENLISIEKKKEVRIALSAKLTKRTKVHDKCTDKESLTHFLQYSVNTCLYECLALDILKNCSCLPIGWNISNPTNARWCEPGNFYKCYQPNYLRSTPWDLKFRLAECNTQCPPRCEEWSYTKSISFKPFGGGVRMRVYFEELSYQEITKVNLLTPEGILGAVGGVMGFWFGASILSLLHLFTWIVDLLYVCVKTIVVRKTEKH